MPDDKGRAYRDKIAALFPNVHKGIKRNFVDGKFNNANMGITLGPEVTDDEIFKVFPHLYGSIEDLYKGDKIVGRILKCTAKEKEKKDA